MLDPLLDIKIALSVAIAAAMTAGLVTGGLELRWMAARGQLTRVRIREMLVSLSPLPPNALVSVLMVPVWAGLYGSAGAWSLFDLPVNVWTLVAAFLLSDLSYYWEHRCAHRLRPLWGLYHAIHHSSAAYSVATAYRVSFINQFFAPAFYLPWILVGFDPILIIGFQLLAFHYQAWLHTELIGRLGVVDAWLNTPANHRMHHSRALVHRDVNMGAILMLWDRLFGTYAQPESALEYGIPDATPPTSWLALYTDPWRIWLLPRRRLDTAV